jgi:hypothetical protein
MPARLPGTAFGPGFSSSGNAVEFDLTDYGLHLVTEESFDGTPPWSDVSLRRRGDGGLLLEWAGRQGRYAIRVDDRAAIEELRTRHPADAAGGRADRPTRAWVRRLIWAALAAAMLIGLLIWQHK